MGDYHLLRKTELRIDGIRLRGANLSTIAQTAADVLGLERSEVLVVDYRDGTLVLDILDSCVNAAGIVGREGALLESIGALTGVDVSDSASVTSDGMLGWVALDGDEAMNALERGEEMAAEILRNVAKRVVVFSSGAEVRDGEIEDTNTPAITESLTAAGFDVSGGGVLEDDRLHIAARMREASEMGGYGVVITTGGLGAEDKDQTAEAVLLLDPDAATPYICHYEIGTGRHVKDGVRIAVGGYKGTLIICLPGPNDEVRASLGPLVHGLRECVPKDDLAESLAANLRSMLRGGPCAHPH